MLSLTRLLALAVTIGTTFSQSDDSQSRRLNFYSDFFSKEHRQSQNAVKRHSGITFSAPNSPTKLMNQPSASVASFDHMNLTAAKLALENVLHLITYRFNLDNKYRAQLFNVAANMNTNTWDIIKVISVIYCVAFFCAVHALRV
jgi:hypothetical protein